MQQNNPLFLPTWLSTCEQEQMAEILAFEAAVSDYNIQRKLLLLNILQFPEIIFIYKTQTTLKKPLKPPPNINNNSSFLSHTQLSLSGARFSKQYSQDSSSYAHTQNWESIFKEAHFPYRQ